MNKPELALTLHPEWAALVVNIIKFPDESTTFKDIENRSWPLPKNFKVPQRIYVHSGKRSDFNNAFEFAIETIGVSVAYALMLGSPIVAPRGVIVGEVDIVDCVEESDSKWFTGLYGFVLSSPIRYNEPIPYKGRQRFFRVDHDYIEAHRDKATKRG